MNADDILKQLNDVFADVIGEAGVVLARETTAQDVDDWDSINHIQFVAAIEKHFRIRFTRSEINSWENVGDICDSIAGKARA